MALEKKLVLFRYLLHQLGHQDMPTLRDHLSSAQTGYDSSGRPYLLGTLMARQGRLIDDADLTRYADRIRGYEAHLRKHRNEPRLSFKYFQWAALLLTEHFLDRLYTDATALCRDINSYKATQRDFDSLEDYAPEDLRKLAYWMATGSGKTLLLHCNYMQMRHYAKEWENIILITPNEGLSRQHYEDMRLSGIPAKLYTGSEESLKTRDGEVLILEITKLVRYKEGGGMSVDVDRFAENRNLVLIDEGHKGQKSEEQTWKKLREHLARGADSFIIEYSATFGQIITGKKGELLQEYGRSIIIDYSYRHFYADGYGKDFSVFNIDADREGYSEEQTDLLMTAGLLGFYEQLDLYDSQRPLMKEYGVERPLWVFVGSRVIGKAGNKALTAKEAENVSDVTRIVRYFNTILSDPARLQRWMDSILNGTSGLEHKDRGGDLFGLRFAHLRASGSTAEEVLEKVFHATGVLEANEIKSADGEIGLRTRLGERMFGVVNIGDVPRYSKKLEEDTGGALKVGADHFTKSLFKDLDRDDSPINILIGSKKFIEGWSSWRVSSMGLMNMGSGEGPQIIQLFGRGVRLKGKGLSLKREESTAPYAVRTLQTLSLFGLNASYMKSFLESIEKEVPEYDEYEVEIGFNRTEEWEGRVLTFTQDAEHPFKAVPLMLDYNKAVAQRVRVDVRSRVMAAQGGFNAAVAEPMADAYGQPLTAKYADFIDFDALTTEVDSFRRLREYHHLVVRRNVVEQVIRKGDYTLNCDDAMDDIGHALNGRMQHLAELVMKDYLRKFYTDREKDHATRHLTFDMMDRTRHAGLFPELNRVIIKAPRERKAEMEALVEDMQQFLTRPVDAIPTLHLNEHLYSPLAVFKDSRGFKHLDIKTVPVKLNEGETWFVNHLHDWLTPPNDLLKDKEVFLLRNLSRNRGVGFFMQSSSFYPDFILWIVQGNKQHIFFLDPKGIRNEHNFQSEKVIFCSETIKEINEAVRAKLTKAKSDVDLTLEAFILSATEFSKAVTFDRGHCTREEFAKNHILFIEEDKAYLKGLIARATIQLSGD